MKNVIHWHGDGTVTVSDPHTGLRLDGERAQRVLSNALLVVVDQRAADRAETTQERQARIAKMALGGTRWPR